MGVKTIALDKLVVSRVHAPQIDGVPLYTHTNPEVDADKSARWKAQAHDVCTSPNNVRRVFITQLGVGIELYKGIKGKRGKRLFLEFNSDDKEKASLAVQSLNNWDSENAQTVIGDGLSALVKPWVCSNVEEIFFDELVLVSNGLGPCRGYMHTLVPGAGTGDGELMKMIALNSLMCGDEESLMARFPRLKYFGYMSHLASAVSEYMKSELDGMAGVIGKFAEHPNVIKYFREPSIATHMWVTHAPRFNQKYHLRAGIYVYDDEILSDWLASLAQQTAAAAEKAARERGGTEPQDSDQPEAVQQSEVLQPGDIERALDSIHDNNTERVLHNAVYAITYKATDDEKRELLAGFTERGKERYGRYIL